MSELLPPDLWTEILVRLPVRTILTLKCVSNYFLFIIQTPAFANLHFSRFNNSYSHFDQAHQLLLIERSSTLERVVCRGSSSAKTCMFPIRVYHCWEDVLGYAEGLFWLHRFYVPWVNATGAICNPSRGKSFPVPPSLTFDELSFHDEGFGYDPLTDDHKAVVFVKKYEANIPSVFTEVFSVRRGTWRSLELNAIPPDWMSRLRGSQHVYVNGCIHWLSHNLNDYEYYPKFTHVVSFDLAHEVFRYRELPGLDEGDYHPLKKLVQLPMWYRGCFAVCYISKFHISIWVMLQDGWVKQQVIDSSHDFYCYLCKLYYEDNHSLFCGAIFSEDTGELLIAWHKKGVISFNLSTQRRTVFHRRVNHIYLNVDSLRWEEFLPSDIA